MIRKAEESDTGAIYDLVQPYAAEKLLLPRSKEQIKNDIPLTWVFCEDSWIKGCINLTPFGENLYEIRALVVKAGYQKKGIGKCLISGVEEHIRIFFALPVHLFALTYEPTFFQKCGFEITDKNKFPKKIYDVCQYCVKKNDCKETAVDKVIAHMR